MKNKEIEELLKGMRDVSNTEGCYMNLDRDLVKLLLSYIEQLENNRDKAIRTLETLKGSARWEKHLYEVDYIKYILKGDSDDE